MTVITVPYARDNFGYVVHIGTQSLIIDPGLAQPFERHITKPPTAILLTHEHWDHINGIPQLLHNYPGTPVFIQNPNSIKHLCEAQPTSNIPETLHNPPKVLFTPGHSFSSVCFYFEQGLAFVGDVLFSMGCGGVFTNDYSAAFTALQTIHALPDSTLLYWGHNYAKSNYLFARGILQNTKELRNYALLMHDQGTGALLANEKRYNPFLQAKTVEEFTCLRNRKSGFCT